MRYQQQTLYSFSKTTQKFLQIITTQTIDFELLAKMKVEALKNYLKIRGLKMTGTKN